MRPFLIPRVPRFVVLLAVLAVWCVPPAVAAPPPAASLDIRFEKYKLPNGLEVILHEDHSIPTVAVNVWYHVGSKNEKRGRTGFAHLFEHMMFQGSQHHDGEYFGPLEKVGAAINGSTTQDRTNYWENVPSNYLELALWLEADRMGFLLPAMTQAKLDNQRDVVKNERRQGLDNEPYAKAFEILPAMAYPADHPYSWPVIGSMEDLSVASLEDVSQFFRNYYAPNNASLCIAGDFDPATAKKLVEKHFGSIPPGPPVDRLSAWVPRLEGVKRGVAEDNVKLPRLYIAWHTSPFFAPGDAEMDLLSNILTSGKTSRLYKSLVYDRQIAQDVSSFQGSQEIGSTFVIIVTAREGHTLDELEQAVDGEIRRLQETGVTAEELAQAQTVWEAQFVRALQRAGGFEGKAERLNLYNVMLGDPGRFQWDLDRYLHASVTDLQAAVRTHLDLGRRVILRIVPQGELKAGSSEVDRASEPSAGPEPSFTPPTFQRLTLANGLTLFVVENPRLPLVQANLVLRSGWAADPKDRFGTASLTAELLDEGTKTRSALQISEEAKRLGASLGSSSSFDSSEVTLNVLKRNLEPALTLLADVVQNPTFPEEELERQRKIYLGLIQQESKDPTASAFKAYLRLLYGAGHPYGQSFTGTGTEASIRAMTRENLVGYYRANYSPDNAALILVGDVKLDEARSRAEAAFRGWRRSSVTARDVPPPPTLAATKIYLVDKPGAAQSVIVAGNPGLRRNDPDWLPFEVMNNALGGQFGSRINMNLREDKGYSYGAGTFFLGTRGVGPFACFAPVQTQNTKESVFEIVREIREVVGPRPLRDDEVVDSKSNLVKGFPQRFESLGGIADQIGEIYTYALPPDEWRTYVGRVVAIGGASATKAARDRLHPDALLIVVVGDREKVEAGLRDLKLGQVEVITAAQL